MLDNIVIPLPARQTLRNATERQVRRQRTGSHKVELAGRAVGAGMQHAIYLLNLSAAASDCQTLDINKSVRVKKLGAFLAKGRRSKEDEG